MERVYIIGQMVIGLKDNGKILTCMEKEFIILKTNARKKENGKMERSKADLLNTILMEDMKNASMPMERKMEKPFIIFGIKK